ncbi:MAG: hypothetical protein NWF01_11400 [Candidatus Bathyarchaeota archaeon]|nr:hypothetical protein [Candidatus Bathyarchaeota archaeon]
MKTVKKKLSKSMVLLLMTVLLVSSLGFIGFVAAQETDVYGTNDNIEILNSIKQLDQNTIVLNFKIQAPSGYSVVWSGTLFEEYIFAGCLVDYPKEKVVDALWTQASYWQSTYNDEVVAKTIKVPLSYIAGYYQGSIAIENLTYGSHSLVVWARNERNMLSFNQVNWAAFQETDFTVSDSTPIPSSPTTTQQPTQSTEPTNNQTITPTSAAIEAQYIYAELFVTVLIVVGVMIWLIYRKLKTIKKIS